MKPRLLASLAQLRPLDSSNAAHGAIRCKICERSSLLFDIVDFNKICAENYYAYGFTGIAVAYYQCQGCGFLFTDFCDDWTKEDFQTHIYNGDYSLIDGDYATVRPARMAAEMAEFLAEQRGARILDYGSGAGAFAEGLRAVGFSAVENYDPFASPQRPLGQFDIVTCFETIEHSPAPREMLADLKSFMRPEGCIIFSTLTQPPNIAELRANWWYVAPRNGHVSIYTPAALELLAAKEDLRLYAAGGQMAFAGPIPAPQLARLLRPLAPPRIAVRLTAPPEPLLTVAPQERLVEADPADWHAVEQSGKTRFRWTQTSHVGWRLMQQPISYPCRLTLTIPLVMEILPGFAAGCRFDIAGRSYEVQREEAAISATVELDRPLETPITLTTPEPRRPCDLRDSPDERSLGLAVPLADAPG